MLAPLDNGTIFKTAFTDKVVFKQFVKDILGIDIEVEKIETEKKFEPKIGNIDFSLDIFAESNDHRVIIEIQRIDYDYNFDRFLRNCKKIPGKRFANRTGFRDNRSFPGRA